LVPQPLPAIASVLPPEASPEGVAFSDMAYARPDTNRIVSWMEGVMLRIPHTEDFRELLGWADTAERLYDHVMSMRTLAMLHSAMDKSDAYWLGEYDQISTESISVYYAYEGLRLTLLDHPDAEALRAVLPRSFFHGLDDWGVDLDRLVPLYEREQSLMNAHSADLATATVEWEGEPLTASEIFMIPDYEDYAAAMAKLEYLSPCTAVIRYDFMTVGFRPYWPQIKVMAIYSLAALSLASVIYCKRDMKLQ